MFRTFIPNPNGITNGMSGHRRRMAVEPVFNGDSGNFIEDHQFGLFWFNLV